jgi:hypothetical protein
VEYDLVAASEKLREPFPPSEIGYLPRVTCGACRDSSTKVCSKHAKKECPRCKSWITSAHVDLDYVGHANVRERLLEVDPAWTWEPMAFDEQGLPRISKDGKLFALWIRLMVCGVSRPGVGTCESSKPEVLKELIGDGLRNAAMSFGVGIDLWKKEGRHEYEGEDEAPAAEATKAPKPASVPKSTAQSAPPPPADAPAAGGETEPLAMKFQVDTITKECTAKGVEFEAVVAELFPGETHWNPTSLRKSQAVAVIQALGKLPKPSMAKAS